MHAIYALPIRTLLALFAFFLSGCAATVNRPTADSAALAPSAAAAKSVVLTLSPVGTATEAPDWQAFREEWQTSMTAATSAMALAFRFAPMSEPTPAQPAVLVKAVVNDFRYVSQAKRYGLGVMAGNAFMDVDVEFIELPTGRSLGKRKYATTSSAWQGIFSAMTPKQVEAVSGEIVREIVKK